jgi:hypothetical protein
VADAVIKAEASIDEMRAEVYTRLEIDPKTSTLVRDTASLTLASCRQNIPAPERGSTGQCQRMSGDTILAEFPAILRVTLHGAR